MRSSAGRSRPADGIDSDLAALERTLASSLESGAMLLDVDEIQATAILDMQLRRLAALRPTTIALMHGPAFKGDGAAALSALAPWIADRAARSMIASATTRPAKKVPKRFADRPPRPC